MATQTIDMNDVQTCTFNNQNVSEIYLNSQKIWPGVEYLKLEGTDSFTLDVFYTWDGTLEFSNDGGTTWTDASLYADNSIASGTNNTLVFRGTNNTCFWDDVDSHRPFFLNMSSGDLTVSGNIETIMDYQTVIAGNHPAMGNYCFNKFFSSWTRLRDIQDLKMPYNMASYGCAEMFASCSNLYSLPRILPATTLANYCYYEMFYGDYYIGNDNNYNTTIELPACLYN